MLYTSGIGLKYPSSIPVGRIVEIVNNKNDVNRYALVEPCVDIGKISEVAVIVNQVKNNMQRVLKIIVTILLFIISLSIQLFIFNNMSLFGVKPNMLLISIIVVSLYTSIYSCTIYSFFLGLIIDLMFGGSGMFTISYTAIGMLLGFINEDYMKENYFSIIILTTLSVALFETVQYFQSMIILSSYVSFFFFLKQVILSILLNVVLVFIIRFIFGKIIEHIDKKQNRIYW